MRSTRQTELTVGLFILCVLVILTLITFRVGDISFGKPKGYVVFANFRNAAGLAEGTSVNIAGVDAGKVESIDLVGGHARIRLRIKEGVQLFSDASALIKSTGLLGDKVLEIRAGTEKPELKDGDSIKYVIESAELDELVRNITDASSNIASLIAELSKPELKDALKETILNVRQLTADLRDAVRDNKAKTYEIVDKIDALITELRDTVHENHIPITNTIANFEQMSASLKDMVEKTRPNIESLAQKTDVMVSRIDSIANKIDNGEGTIGKLVNDPKLYNSVAGAADSVGKTLSKIDRFRTFITFKGDYYTRHQEGKGFFNVRLQPSDDKYYVLGVVSDPVGNVQTTYIKKDGQTVTKEEVTTPKLEFNAQIARRFGNTALRIGLFESTFGVGAEQYFFNDKLILSADAWDFSENEYLAENPHVRLAADYFVFKHLFVSAGYDNIFNKKRDSFFVGGGVFFEDEDLKYLFGSVPKVP